MTATGSNMPRADEPTEARSHLARWIGLGLAPALGLVVWALVPAEVRGAGGEVIMGSTGRVVAAVGVFMATLWITEALPIAATALLPIALFPLLTGGEISAAKATAPYADDVIFLFMGGFMMALAMERWGLHRRLALSIVLLVGTRPAALVAGFMIASAALSMWVSNTATVVMMLPIAISVITLVRREIEKTGGQVPTGAGGQFNFAVCLLLGTAYGASIGGVGTIIGTPPNIFMVEHLAELGIEISFARWMLVGVPFVVVFIPIAWAVLTRIVYPIRIREIPGGRALIRRELENQGPMSRAELAVLIVFLITAILWVTRPMLALIEIGAPPWRPLAGVNDSVIAIGAALVLFGLPIDWKRGVFLLTWEQAVKLPWGTLLLFGGGLSLAAAVRSSGLADSIGLGVQSMQNVPEWLLVLAVITLLVFLTELTSNTATIATFLPVLSAIALGLNIEPILLIVPATISVSLAFMMPVATPPNAIVFGSGEITIAQMCRAGLWLNIIGIALVFVLTYFDVAPALLAK
ncbi:MAG: DASS family sodium-coupled anion symporter [Phycisphaerales bacterium]|nr:DASS family sodium-coupled anion symporter [Phycisphaerales bacterium]